MKVSELAWAKAVAAIGLAASLLVSLRVSILMPSSFDPDDDCGRRAVRTSYFPVRATCGSEDFIDPAHAHTLTQLTVAAGLITAVGVAMLAWQGLCRRPYEISLGEHGAAVGAGSGSPDQDRRSDEARRATVHAISIAWRGMLLLTAAGWLGVFALFLGGPGAVSTVLVASVLIMAGSATGVDQRQGPGRGGLIGSRRRGAATALIGAVLATGAVILLGDRVHPFQNWYGPLLWVLTGSTFAVPVLIQWAIATGTTRRQ